MSLSGPAASLEAADGVPPVFLMGSAGWSSAESLDASSAPFELVAQALPLGPSAGEDDLTWMAQSSSCACSCS